LRNYKPLAPIVINKTTATARPTNKPNRKTRYDKLAPRKFPVTEEENKTLRRLYKSMRGELQAKSITEFFNMLLRFGLSRPEMLHTFDSYKVTDIFKTVKPNQLEKDVLEDLAIDWSASERKAIHGVIFSVLEYIEKGGHISYEEVQPFRPSK
jgi:hypothetical protein